MESELTHRGTRSPQEEKPPSEPREDRLNLLEELATLSFKYEGDAASVWKDSVSLGLRCAIMAELGLRGKAMADSKTHLCSVMGSSCGDGILDEALETMRGSRPREVEQWVELFSGITWNPLNLTYQIRNLRHRVCKSLSEKGICSVELRDSLFTNFALHSFKDSTAKQRIIRRIHDLLFRGWSSNVYDMDLTAISLVVLAEISDVLQTFYSTLSISEYTLASSRVHALCSLDFQTLAHHHPNHALLWLALACNKIILF